MFESTADKNHPELPVLAATQEFGMIKRDDTGINISHDKRNEATYKRVLPGQFVIHLRSFQGGFAHSAFEGITSPAYTVFGFRDSEKQDDYFWKYVFHSDAFIHRLETVTYGIRDGRSISYEEFLTMNFYVPPYEEQKRISTFLLKLDHLITLHQRVSFRERVTRTINGHKKTDSWEQREFEKSFSLLQNNTLSRAELSESSGFAANIHYGDVLIKFGEYLDMLQETFPWIKKKADADKFRTSFLQDGDVIFADTAEDETVGKCCEIRNCGSTAIISGLHTIPCRPVSEFAPGYLGYYLNSAAFHEQLVPLMQGTKVVSISKAALKSTLIRFPSDEKAQQKIGAFFRGIDRLITLHQREYLLFEVLLC